MKVIIAGSRDFKETEADELVAAAIANSCFSITVVVSGHCKGIDRAGERWADKNGIPKKIFEVTRHDWKVQGLSAGPIRNGKMAVYADALIAIPGPKSKGTIDMIKQAEKIGIYVYVLPNLKECT